VAGPPGPTGQHCLVPPRCCPAPPDAHLAPCHVSDPWELLLSQLEALIQVSLELHQPTSRPSFTMCCPNNRHCEPTNAVGSRGGGVEGRAAPSLGRPAPKSPPPTSWLPTSTPMPPYTINRGCGAQWKTSH